MSGLFILFKKINDVVADHIETHFFNIFERLLVDRKRAIDIFVERLDSLLVFAPGLDHGRIICGDQGFLIDQPLLHGRIVKLDQEIVFLDDRAFGNHLENPRSPRSRCGFEFADDLQIV